jgi:hypothetical protein
VTECALTAATAPDGAHRVKLLAGEEPGLEVLGDSGYGSGATRAALRAAGHSQTIKPIPLQSAIPGGFTIHDFRIDRQAGTVRCPTGRTAPITSSGQASFVSSWPSCSLRRRCTTAKQGRTIRAHPHEDELRAARRRATTRSFQQSYRRWRPMVERSLAWLVTDSCRRVAYRGIPRNDLWWSLRVAAVNLRRLLALGLTRQDPDLGAGLTEAGCHPGWSAPGTTVRHALPAIIGLLHERPAGPDRQLQQAPRLYCRCSRRHDRREWQTR